MSDISIHPCASELCGEYGECDHGVPDNHVCFDCVDRRVAELEEKSTQLENENSELGDRVYRLENECSDLHGKIGRLESKYADLERRVGW